MNFEWILNEINDSWMTSVLSRTSEKDPRLPLASWSIWGSQAREWRFLIMETSNKSKQSFCFWGREKWAITSTFFLVSLNLILLTQEIPEQTHISVKWGWVQYFQLGSSAFKPVQDTILASGRTGRNPGSHDTLFYSPLYDYLVECLKEVSKVECQPYWISLA